MKIIFEPSHLSGTVCAPPSKSISHRMLICAGLSDGRSLIRGIDYSEDILATLDCLEELGATVNRRPGEVEIKGVNRKNCNQSPVFRCRESGSTLRFFVPIALVLSGKSVFTGAKRLFERPLDVYEDICKSGGINYLKGEGRLEIGGGLKAGEFSFRGDISSQFVTGLLFALPLCEGESILKIIPPFESRAYADMTLDVLSDFGVSVSRTDENTFSIRGNQNYLARNAVVEGDYSNAAFFEAMKITGGDIEISGLDPESLQGDKAYISDMPDIAGGFCEKNICECPDLAPVYMALAAASHGAAFVGVERLKIKESDRGAAMAEELLKFGIKTDISDGRIVVNPGHIQKPTECLFSHNDHRIVMALSVLLLKTGGAIEGAEAVSKSYPGFFDDVRSVGGKFTEC